MTNFKLVAVAVLFLGILTVGAGLLAQQTGGGDVGRRNAKPDQPAASGLAAIEPAVNALVKARLETARDVFKHEMERYEHTLTLFGDDASVWSRRWMEAELLLSPNRAEKLASIQAHVERVKRLESIAGQYAKTGQGRASDALKAKYFRLEAEQMLVEAQATQPNVR